MAWRGPNCVFLGHSAPGTSENSAPNPSLFPSSNASKRITELVAENIDIKGDLGESDFIPVIKIFY
jgi:hypothetical protein